MMTGVRMLASTVVIVLSLAACGQDATDPQTKKSPAEDRKLARACAANAEIGKGFNKIFAGLPPQKGPPDRATVAKIKQGIDKQVLPHVKTVEANAPDEITDEVEIAAGSVRDFRANPARDPFEEEETQDAIDEVNEFFFENCDFEKATVHAKEYEFAEIPDDLKTGDLSVRLENDGREVHELIVFRKSDGVAESFDQILDLPEEQVTDKVQFIGAAHAAPGEEDYSTLSFEKPGDYVAVCFIPQGTTEHEPGEGGEGGATPAVTAGTAGTVPSPSPGAQQGGPPHFKLGMKKEFKVV